MATQVQVRGGVTATQSVRTFVSRSLDIDTTAGRLNVHNGSAQGGIPHVNFVDALNQTFTYASCVGTNALALTVLRAPEAYTTGQKIRFIAQNTNTGATTVNLRDLLSDLGAKTIKKMSGSALVSLSGGEIKQGMYYEIVYNGTDFILASGGASSSGSRALFTSSGSFEVPAGISTIYVTASAGGGGGSTTGSSDTNPGGAGGGGGEACFSKPIAVNSGEIITITVGSGGNGAAANGNNGGNGGNTVIGGYLTLTGGYGAIASTGGNGGGAGGVRGSGGYNLGGSSPQGGAGGGSMFGAGAPEAHDNTSSSAGGAYGGGGAGGSRAKAAGAGAAGFVLIEW